MVRSEPHTLACALHVTCAHLIADITTCVLCGRTLEPKRPHVDTCGKVCFVELLAMQRAQ